MLVKIFGGLAALLIVLAIVIAMQPEDFRVSRSAIMNATPDAVFTQINDFRKWEAWSPWAKVDPNAVMTYEGPEAGAGAIAKWAGNNEVGEGVMIITDSRPGELVAIRLDFIKPFTSTSSTEFTLKPATDGAGTEVTWSMYGKNNFLSKAISLVMDCEKMVGEQYDKGLANLKALVEQG